MCTSFIQILSLSLARANEKILMTAKSPVNKQNPKKSFVNTRRTHYTVLSILYSKVKGNTNY